MLRIAKLVVLFMAGGCAAFATLLTWDVPNSSPPDTSPWAANATGISTSGLRFQEIIGGGQFKNLPVQYPMVITGLDFSSAPGEGAFSLDLSDLLIYMAYASVAPNSYSGHTPPNDTYSANFSSPGVEVYNGPQSMDDSGCSSGPCPYDIHVTLSTPFLYDPTVNKALVLDMALWQSYGTPETGALAGVQWADLSNQSNSVASVQGGIPGTVGTVFPEGLDVQLDYYYLPEPGSWLLLTSGILAIAFARRRLPCAARFR